MDQQRDLTRVFRPTKELMVRWAQANALLPSMQFSIPPWTFDGECAQLCLKAVEWHQKYADLIVQLAKEATETGWPIVRPMFWLAPNDKKTYTIGDQFVLGDKVVSFTLDLCSLCADVFRCRLWLQS
jgi:alpha-glucosidase (family GH31 glycosyl hydrolase)